jgi:putative ABC transport system permease protein
MEKFLTLLSILGVALGIGLFTGVKTASDRAVEVFEADVRGIDPHAEFEVIDISGIDFNEDIYKKVRETENSSFPVLSVVAYLPIVGDTINISGIDVIRMSRFLEGAGPGSEAFADIFREVDGVYVTHRFSERYSMGKGDFISADVYDGRYRLQIVGVFDGETLPANLVIMDLGNFQEYFGKTGLLSRLDVSADEDARERIRGLLPSNLLLQEKERIIENRKALLKSFRYNLQFVSFISILVGIFLLYNTVFISVVKRRTEIGILRGLGAGKKTIVGIFLIQGLVLGSVGSLLGIVLGQVFAYFSAAAIGSTISTMYSAVEVYDYLISWSDAAKALMLGLFVSFAASAVPAYEASRIRPNESAREGSFEGKYKKFHGLFSLAGLFFVVLGGALSLIDYHYMPFDFPFLAYAGILFIITGFTLFSPFYLSTALQVSKKLLEKFFGPTGTISGGDIRGNVYRFSVALMSVAISSALIVALLTLIFSFRNSLKEWIHKNISADVYIKPSSCVSNFCFFPLSEEVVGQVKQFPEVAAIDEFRTLAIDFRDGKIVAGFGNPDIGRTYPAETDTASRNDGTASTDHGRTVGISKYLSIKYGLKEGDPVEIPTPSGKREFVVRDVFSSYSTTSGFIYLDRKYLKEYWGLDDSTQLGVYLREGMDADGFIVELKRLLPPNYSLDIMNNEELRNRVMSIFNKTFSITYAIELISIIVSLMGVVNTILALVLERKREISIIRYLGGSWDQIRNMLVLSAGLLGICGIFLGLILGSAMSVIFISVVNKISFGWEIHFRFPVLPLFLVSCLLFLTTLGAGLIPSRVAKKIDPKRFISFE